MTGPPVSAMTVRLGYDRDFLPFTREAADGRAEGVVVDILWEVRQRVDLDFALVSADLPDRGRLLAQEELDGWACMAVTADRASAFVFSLPYALTGGGLFLPVQKDGRGGAGVNAAALPSEGGADEIEAGGTLVPRDLVVATPASGPLAGVIGSLFPGAGVLPVDDYRTALGAVLRGEAGAAALNFHAGRHLARACYPHRFRFPTTMFAPVELAVAMRTAGRGQAVGFLERLNSGLRALAEGGLLERLLAEWGLGGTALPAGLSE